MSGGDHRVDLVYDEDETPFILQLLRFIAWVVHALNAAVSLPIYAIAHYFTGFLAISYESDNPRLLTSIPKRLVGLFVLLGCSFGYPFLIGYFVGEHVVLTSGAGLSPVASFFVATVCATVLVLWGLCVIHMKGPEHNWQPVAWGALFESIKLALIDGAAGVAGIIAVFGLVRLRVLCRYTPADLREARPFLWRQLIMTLADWCCAPFLLCYAVVPWRLLALQREWKDAENRMPELQGSLTSRLAQVEIKQRVGLVANFLQGVADLPFLAPLAVVVVTIYRLPRLKRRVRFAWSGESDGDVEQGAPTTVRGAILATARDVILETPFMILAAVTVVFAVACLISWRMPFVCRDICKARRGGGRCVRKAVLESAVLLMADIPTMVAMALMLLPPHRLATVLRIVLCGKTAANSGGGVSVFCFSSFDSPYLRQDPEVCIAEGKLHDWSYLSDRLTPHKAVFQQLLQQFADLPFIALSVGIAAAPWRLLHFLVECSRAKTAATRRRAVVLNLVLAGMDIVTLLPMAVLAATVYRLRSLKARCGGKSWSHPIAQDAESGEYLGLAALGDVFDAAPHSRVWAEFFELLQDLPYVVLLVLCCPLRIFVTARSFFWKNQTAESRRRAIWCQFRLNILDLLTAPAFVLLAGTVYRLGSLQQRVRSVQTVWKHPFKQWAHPASGKYLQPLGPAGLNAPHVHVWAELGELLRDLPYLVMLLLCGPIRAGPALSVLFCSDKFGIEESRRSSVSEPYTPTTAHSRRRACWIQVQLAALDLLSLPAVALLGVSVYRLGSLKERLVGAGATKWAHPVPTGYTEPLGPRGLNAPHFHVWAELLELLVDLPYLVPLLLCCPLRLGPVLSVLLCRKEQTAVSRRRCCWEQFQLHVLDILTLPFMLALLATVYRVPSLGRRLHGAGAQNWAFPDGGPNGAGFNSPHPHVFREFFELLIDLPFGALLLGSFCCPLRTLPALRDFFLHAKGASQKRSSAVQSFMLALLDLPWLVAAVLLRLTNYRWKRVALVHAGGRRCWTWHAGLTAPYAEAYGAGNAVWEEMRLGNRPAQAEEGNEPDAAAAGRCGSGELCARMSPHLALINELVLGLILDLPFAVPALGTIIEPFRTRQLHKHLTGVFSLARGTGTNLHRDFLFRKAIVAHFALAVLDYVAIVLLMFVVITRLRLKHLRRRLAVANLPLDRRFFKFSFLVYNYLDSDDPDAERPPDTLDDRMRGSSSVDLPRKRKQREAEQEHGVVLGGAVKVAVCSACGAEQTTGSETNCVECGEGLPRGAMPASSGGDTDDASTLKSASAPRMPASLESGPSTRLQRTISVAMAGFDSATEHRAICIEGLGAIAAIVSVCLCAPVVIVFAPWRIKIILTLWRRRFEAQESAWRNSRQLDVQSGRFSDTLKATAKHVFLSFLDMPFAILYMLLHVTLLRIGPLHSALGSGQRFASRTGLPTAVATGEMQRSPMRGIRMVPVDRDATATEGGGGDGGDSGQETFRAAAAALPTAPKAPSAPEAESKAEPSAPPAALSASLAVAPPADFVGEASDESDDESWLEGRDRLVSMVQMEDPLSWHTCVLQQSLLLAVQLPFAALCMMTTPTWRGPTLTCDLWQSRHCSEWARIKIVVVHALLLFLDPVCLASLLAVGMSWRHHQLRDSLSLAKLRLVDAPDVHWTNVSWRRRCSDIRWVFHASVAGAVMFELVMLVLDIPFAVFFAFLTLTGWREREARAAIRAEIPVAEATVVDDADAGAIDRVSAAVAAQPWLTVSDNTVRRILLMRQVWLLVVDVMCLLLLVVMALIAPWRLCRLQWLRRGYVGNNNILGRRVDETAARVVQVADTDRYGKARVRYSLANMVFWERSVMQRLTMDEAIASLWDLPYIVLMAPTLLSWRCSSLVFGCWRLWVAIYNVARQRSESVRAAAGFGSEHSGGDVYSAMASTATVAVPIVEGEDPNAHSADKPEEEAPPADFLSTLPMASIDLARLDSGGDNPLYGPRADSFAYGDAQEGDEADTGAVRHYHMEKIREVDRALRRLVVRELFELFVDLPYFVLLVLCVPMRFVTALSVVLSRNGQTAESRRRAVWFQFRLNVLDIVTIPAMALLAVTGYRLGSLKARLVSAGAAAWAHPVPTGYAEPLGPTGLNAPHPHVWAETWQLIVDVPFLVMLALCCPFRLVPALSIIACREGQSAESRRRCVFQQFRLHMLDIATIPALLVLIISGYRIGSLRDRLRAAGTTKWAHPAPTGYTHPLGAQGLNAPHPHIWAELKEVMIDIPYVALFALCCPLRLDPVMNVVLCWPRQTAISRRRCCWLQFKLHMLDIVTVPAFSLLFITGYRLPSLRARLRYVGAAKWAHPAPTGYFEPLGPQGLNAPHAHVWAEFRELITDAPYLPLLIAASILPWRLYWLLQNWNSPARANVHRLQLQRSLSLDNFTESTRVEEKEEEEALPVTVDALLNKRAVVVGTSRDDLNGREGVVESFDAAMERCLVALDGDGGTISLKCEKLKPLGEHPRGARAPGTDAIHRRSVILLQFKLAMLDYAFVPSLAVVAVLFPYQGRELIAHYEKKSGPDSKIGIFSKNGSGHAATVKGAFYSLWCLLSDAIFLALGMALVFMPWRFLLLARDLVTFGRTPLEQRALCVRSEVARKRRFMVFDQFAMALLDVPALASALALLGTLYRLGNARAKVRSVHRDCRTYSRYSSWALVGAQFQCARATSHFIVIREAFSCILDIPYILLGAVVTLTLWRAPHMWYKLLGPEGYNVHVAKAITAKRRFPSALSRWYKTQQHGAGWIPNNEFPLANRLPKVALNVFQFLSGEDTARCEMTCAYWRDVSATNWGTKMWQEKCDERMPPFQKFVDRPTLPPKGVFVERLEEHRQRLRLTETAAAARTDLEGGGAALDPAWCSVRWCMLLPFQCLMGLFSCCCEVSGPHGIVLWEFLNVLVDIPFVLVGLASVVIAPWRLPVFVGDMFVHAQSEKSRRRACTEMLAMAILDVPAAVALILLKLSQYRMPSFDYRIASLKEAASPDARHTELTLRHAFIGNWGDRPRCAQAHIVALRELVALLCDLPFLACGTVVALTCWRRPAMMATMRAAAVVVDRRAAPGDGRLRVDGCSFERLAVAGETEDDIEQQTQQLVERALHEPGGAASIIKIADMTFDQWVRVADAARPDDGKSVALAKAFCACRRIALQALLGLLLVDIPAMFATAFIFVTMWRAPTLVAMWKQPTDGAVLWGYRAWRVFLLALYDIVTLPAIIIVLGFVLRVPKLLSRADANLKGLKAVLERTADDDDAEGVEARKADLMEAITVADYIPTADKPDLKDALAGLLEQDGEPALFPVSLSFFRPLIFKEVGRSLGGTHHILLGPVKLVGCLLMPVLWWIEFRFARLKAPLLVDSHRDDAGDGGSSALAVVGRAQDLGGGAQLNDADAPAGALALIAGGTHSEDLGVVRRNAERSRHVRRFDLLRNSKLSPTHSPFLHLCMRFRWSLPEVPDFWNLERFCAVSLLCLPLLLCNELAVVFFLLPNVIATLFFTVGGYTLLWGEAAEFFYFRLRSTGYDEGLESDNDDVRSVSMVMADVNSNPLFRATLPGRDLESGSGPVEVPPMEWVGRKAKAIDRDGCCCGSAFARAVTFSQDVLQPLFAPAVFAALNAALIVAPCAIWTRSALWAPNYGALSALGWFVQTAWFVVALLGVTMARRSVRKSSAFSPLIAFRRARQGIAAMLRDRDFARLPLPYPVHMYVIALGCATHRCKRIGFAGEMLLLGIAPVWIGWPIFIPLQLGQEAWLGLGAPVSALLLLVAIKTIRDNWRNEAPAYLGHLRVRHERHRDTAMEEWREWLRQRRGEERERRDALAKFMAQHEETAQREEEML